MLSGINKVKWYTGMYLCISKNCHDMSIFQLTEDFKDFEFALLWVISNSSTFFTSPLPRLP